MYWFHVVSVEMYNTKYNIYTTNTEPAAKINCCGFMVYLHVVSVET